MRTKQANNLISFLFFPFGYITSSGSAQAERADASWACCSWVLTLTTWSWRQFPCVLGPAQGSPHFTCSWGPQGTHTSGKLATSPGGSYDNKSLELFTELRKVQYLQLQFSQKECPQGRAGKEHGTSTPSLEGGPITPRGRVCSQPGRSSELCLILGFGHD